MIVKIDKLTINVPDANAQQSAWKLYLNKLRDEFPRDRANELFLYTWRFNGTFSYTTDSDFNDYFKKKGIDLPNDAAKALAASKDATGAIADTIGTMFNIAKYAVPIVGGVTLLIVLYFLFNVAKKGDIGAVAALHPAGRGMKAAKMLGK